MIEWTLLLNDGLKLRFDGMTAEELEYSAFFKLRLRRYAKGFEGNMLLFKSGLNYLNDKQIVALCDAEAKKRDITLKIDPSLTAFLDAKEMYMAERTRMGVEIKQQENKFTEQLEVYRAIVDHEMTRRLRDKQMWDSFYMCMMKKSGNFSVPGSGKTSSVLGMYAYLHAKGLVRRIVVICPKNTINTWKEEFVACFGRKQTLRTLDIHDGNYPSTEAKKRALAYESGAANLITMNYESLKTYRREIGTLVDSQTLLVYDEVHKVKRIGGEYARHAVDIAKNASYVVAMTGTPIPNSYCDIYNVLHILYPDEYDEFFAFEPGELKEPDARLVETINDKIQPFFCRTNKKQLSVPDANPDTLMEIPASKPENEIFRILAAKYAKNKLPLFLRVLQLESNPGLLLRTLDLSEFRYILDEDDDDLEGLDYADYSEQIRMLIESIDQTEKFRACVRLLQGLQKEGKPVIVWCIFRDTMVRLQKAMTQCGIGAHVIYGGTSLEERQKLLKDFKAGAFGVLITNPHTLAESISLHDICHDAVYFEYSYNLVHLLQSKDRIHRLGLPEGQYTQYIYLQCVYETKNGAFSMDANVYERLKEKEQRMLDAIDSHVLEVMPTSDEELEAIFAQLRLE